ncbi:MAG TPA: hypothetical protein PKX91_04490 [Clostridia bacterium]|jgi:hypothetical protein|nr:hypothetical protein [Clostridia bacterium]
MKDFIRKKIVVPQELWKDYDPKAMDLNIQELATTQKDSYVLSRYQIDAIKVEDGMVQASIKVTTPIFDTNKIILLLGNYSAPPATSLALSLVDQGYIVISPDLTGLSSYPTKYPKSLEYCLYNVETKDRLEHLEDTAFESNQYTYSKIVKRTLVFIDKMYPEKEVVLVTLGDSIEVGMQTVGSSVEHNIKGMACINGSGYKEYLGTNKFGEDSEIAIDITQERIGWLSAVAAVSYARNIKIPTLIAIGSNAEFADMDRLINLQTLCGENEIFTIIHPGITDYLPPSGYRSVLAWINAIFKNLPIPTRPKVEIRVNEENKVYFDVDCDPSQLIEEVRVYYSYGEYNHALRGWHFEKAISISYNEYIASPKIYEADVPLFTFAEVIYANGLTISSLVEYIELEDYDIEGEDQTKQSNKLVVLYNVTDGIGLFKEEFDGEVLLENTLRMTKIPSGAKGITTDSNAMKIYPLELSLQDVEDKDLQIELYSDFEGRVEIVLQCSIDKKIVEFTAYKMLKSNEFFTSCRFSEHDFKDKTMKPLPSWDLVRSIRIKGRKLVVGNILFI